jgi:solute carrier family 41
VPRRPAQHQRESLLQLAQGYERNEAPDLATDSRTIVPCQANIGELDVRQARRGLILGQLSLLQMQALAVSFLAGILSFLLGLTLPHRISDEDLALSNSTTAANVTLTRTLLAGRDDPDEGYIDSFKEGFTPPGGKELMIVLVTGMVAASLSSGILGSFMSGLVVLSRRLRINPGARCFATTRNKDLR